jgi:hypothetical protein
MTDLHGPAWRGARRHGILRWDRRELKKAEIRMNSELFDVFRFVPDFPQVRPITATINW